MKIALAHEYLIKMGGAERVLIDLLEEFGDVPVFTFLLDREKLFPVLKNKPNIYPSFLQRYPLWRRFYRFYFALMPLAAESLDFSGFDVVMSSTHQFMKGIIVPQDTIHIAYIHTPTRFLWLQKKPRFLPHRLFTALREWDYLAAQRPDIVVANSYNVARRIEKFYRRQAKVIYPAVRTDSYFISEPKDYFLLVSRLEPHKKTELAVEAFKKLPFKLKIVGTGSEYPKLKKNASGAKNIEFLGFVPDEELKKLYSSCLALIFPQEEDFGLVPLEVQASGRPVIAFGKGGALETVKQGETGMFFFPQTPEALEEAVKKFKARDFDPQRIRKWAESFDVKVFKKKMRRLVEDTVREFKEKRFNQVQGF